MKRFALLSGLIVLIAAQIACNLFTVGLATPELPVQDAPPLPNPSPTADLPLPPAATVTPQGGAPSQSAFTPDLLNNFTYFIEDFNLQAPLQAGEFNNGEVVVRLVAFTTGGDLNGDGRPDAAVVVSADPSGSGTFYDLIALVDEGGTPRQAAFTTIGDRQGINRLEIAGGRLVLDYVTQGLSDPLCCPSEHRLRSYVLEGGALRLASEQVLDSPTAQATPLPNAILIDQPGELARLSTPLQVTGRVSVVPPERSLAYYVTDMNATLLDQGVVDLYGDAGGPGTFSFQLNLEGVSYTIVQLELVDAANGILRGRSVVLLLAE